MSRRFAVIVVAVVLLALPGVAQASHFVHFGPGAPGIGDPYFPLDGNGGYDVAHYDLDIAYEPSTDVLRGIAKIRADGQAGPLELQPRPRSGSTSARWSSTGARRAGRATVASSRSRRAGACASASDFKTVIAYDGVPETLGDSQIGLSGFIHTDDGTLVAGQPDVASNWYPVNDHPLDKASYSFAITVPRGLQAIANGVLADVDNGGRSTTWEWEAKEPMASYLTTATIGEFDVDAYRADGITTWMRSIPTCSIAGAAHRPALRDLADRRAVLQAADAHAQRARGRWRGCRSGSPRDTEPNWDFFFVEAHTVGVDDWTTLPDVNGHTAAGSRAPPARARQLHPFLAHYLSVDDAGECMPTGETGEW